MNQKRWIRECFEWIEANNDNALWEKIRQCTLEQLEQIDGSEWQNVFMTCCRTPGMESSAQAMYERRLPSSNKNFTEGHVEWSQELEFIFYLSCGDGSLKMLKWLGERPGLRSLVLGLKATGGVQRVWNPYGSSFRRACLMNNLEIAQWLIDETFDHEMGVVRALQKTTWSKDFLLNLEKKVQNKIYDETLLKWIWFDVFMRPEFNSMEEVLLLKQEWEKPCLSETLLGEWRRAQVEQEKLQSAWGNEKTLMNKETVAEGIKQKRL